MKKIKIKCNNCDFELEIFESEFTNDTECDLCLIGIMEKEGSKSNSCSGDCDNCNEEVLKEELDKESLEDMIRHIKELGADKVWETINCIYFETRLSYIELYIEAINKIKGGNNE